MSKRIALTFDDGPDNETPNILEMLEKNEVKVTFFCIGKRVEANPLIVKMAHLKGHQIANHSYSHPDNGAWGLSVLSEEEVIEEIEKTQIALEKATGKKPRFFRAPYGATGGNVGKALQKLGLLPAVGWDIDTQDWGFRPSGCTSPDDIKKEILDHAHAGDGKIVLCHDGVDLYGVGCSHRKNTTEALDGVISTLKKDGYTFVTIAELMNEPPYK